MHRALPFLRLWWKHLSPYALKVVGFGAAFSLAEQQRPAVLTDEAVVFMRVYLLHFLHLFLWCRFALSALFSFSNWLRCSYDLDGLDSKKPATILTSTETFLLVISERVKVIVECQFSACRDVYSGKYSNARLSLHSPLSRLTVGVAAVVDESGMVGLLTCVNDQTLVQRQHVEVVGVALM